MNPDIADVIGSLCASGATLTVQAHDPLNPGFGFEAILESSEGRKTGSGNTTTAAIVCLAIHAGDPTVRLVAPGPGGDVPLG